MPSCRFRLFSVVSDIYLQFSAPEKVNVARLSVQERTNKKQEEVRLVEAQHFSKLIISGSCS